MGVTKDILEAGDGKTFPKVGDKLKMHYVGTLASNGKQFDSSRDRGDLFEFTIGQGQVIKGWDEGVIKMSIGERAVLNITSDFGYGERGAGADIPANAALVFDVELVGIGDQTSEKLSESKYRCYADCVAFKAKLDKWAQGQLTKYDTKPDFKEKKDKIHTDRATFEAFLTADVEKTVADIKFHPVPTSE